MPLQTYFFLLWDTNGKSSCSSFLFSDSTKTYLIQIVCLWKVWKREVRYFISCPSTELSLKLHEGEEMFNCGCTVSLNHTEIEGETAKRIGFTVKINLHWTETF